MTIFVIVIIHFCRVLGVMEMQLKLACDFVQVLTDGIFEFEAL